MWGRICHKTCQEECCVLNPCTSVPIIWSHSGKPRPSCPCVASHTPAVGYLRVPATASMALSYCISEVIECPCWCHTEQGTHHSSFITFKCFWTLSKATNASKRRLRDGKRSKSIEHNLIQIWEHAKVKSDLYQANLNYPSKHLAVRGLVYMKRKSALSEGVQGCAVTQCVMKATVPSATPSGPACDCTNIGCLYGNSCIYIQVRTHWTCQMRPQQ